MGRTLLRLRPFLLELLILDELLEALELLELRDPLVAAERGGDEAREGRVGLEEPATGGDAVRDVGEVAVEDDGRVGGRAR